MRAQFLKRRGFTLVEIIIVIAIIGILAGIITASALLARTKARDEKRLGDLRELQIGLALYHDVNRAYPLTANNITDLDILVTQKYLPSIPTDPLAGASYEYMVTGSRYCLGVTLERTPPTGSINCTLGVGSTANYKAGR